MSKYNYTIIIPHYSSDGDLALLYRLLESIPSRDDIEIIVADNSPVPIDSALFQDMENLQVIYSDNRRGAGGARNQALKCVNGRWILFADSDDFFTVDAFSIMDEYIAQVVDVVFFDVTSCMSEDISISSDRHRLYSEAVELYLTQGDSSRVRYRHYAPWGKLLRREFILDNNITFEEIPYSNDVLFSFLVGVKAKEIAVDGRQIYCVTFRDGSLTSNISAKNIACRFKVCIRRNRIVKRESLNIDRLNSYIYLAASVKLGVKPTLRILSIALLSGDIFVWMPRIFRSLLKRIRVIK